MNYKPPYTITDKILTKVSDIVELVSELNNIKKEFNTPKLRKKNRVKSITGTLQIEGNTFDEDKITKVIDGKVVLGYDWFGNPQYAELDETTLKSIALVDVTKRRFSLR